jgi:hypothetical protein
MRLRTTADPAHRPTAYATRGGASVRSCTKRSVTAPALRRRARARASNVAWPRTRRIRRRDASGRAHGGRGARHDRHACACGRGNRGSSCVCGCSAGTCASNAGPPGGCRAGTRGSRDGRQRTTQCRGRRSGSQRGRAAPRERPPTANTRPTWAEHPLNCALVDAERAMLRCAPRRTAAWQPANFPGGPPWPGQADTENLDGKVRRSAWGLFL